MSTLKRALEIAEEAHAGQFDKGGNPYIEHPKRVMNRLKHLGDDYAIVGILHDLIEDTEWTLEDLRKEGFSEYVLEGIDGVTRRVNETYKNFIIRSKENDLSRRCKIEDTLDNLDTTRLNRELTEEDLRRNRRYEQNLKELE